MNAEQHDNLMREIERDEAWLTVVIQAYPEPPCPALTALKQRVRAELVLSVHLADKLPSANVAVSAAKSVVRAELQRMAASDQPAATPRRTDWWWRHRVAAGVLAAAAAVALLVLPMKQPTPDTGSDAPPVPRIAQAGFFDDLRASLALSATSDFDAAVATVAADIDELYDGLTLANDWNIGEDIDDLDDDLQELFEELRQI